MRQLLVMRHAKSDWDHATVADHDRPLAPRGVQAARLMGRFLAGSEHVPELVVSSTAERARRTAELAAEAGGWECPLTFEAALYEADPGVVLTVLARLDPALGRVMVVAHEPTLSSTIARLTGAVVRFPTAAVACVAVDRDTWRSPAGGGGELRWLVVPKLLRRLVPGGELA